MKIEFKPLDWTTTSYPDGSKTGRYIDDDGIITYYHREANGPWRRGLSQMVQHNPALAIDIRKVKWP